MSKLACDTTPLGLRARQRDVVAGSGRQSRLAMPHPSDYEPTNPRQRSSIRKTQERPTVGGLTAQTK